jgi:survival-of-motor-neuron-related-splicing factor 30
MAEETHSVEELQANLADYREQLQQVETLLLSDHTNAELREMYDNLTEVMELTEELLRDAGVSVSEAARAAALPQAAAVPAADPHATAAAAAAAGPGSSSHDPLLHYQQQQQQLVTPAQLNIPAMLPASVADQIRKAQVKQALLGQGNPAWAVGAECLALYGGDGQYYKATVKSVTDEGKFVVLYEGYGTEEEVGGVGRGVAWSLHLGPIVSSMSVHESSPPKAYPAAAATSQ